MLKLGYKASAEQFPPRELLEFAVHAENVGFDSILVSDHFQPWRHTGGHAPYSFAWLGALLVILIFVRLARHAREAVDSFQAHAESLREVVAVYHVSGAHDFLVHVAVRDANHLRDVAMDSFTTRSEVSNIETHLIFASSRNWQLPAYSI